MDFITVFCNWLLDFTNIDLLLGQSFFMYVLYLLLKTRNIFYTLFYFFILLISTGVFICFSQLELFAGFLWVTEFSVVLVLLILLIYLNADGYVKYSHSLEFFRYSYTISLSFILLYLNFSVVSSKYHFLFDYICLWDNYYEALNNINVNDFNGLFMSYYVLNSLELVIFALLLLVATFVCVMIFKSFYSYKVIPYSTFFSLFNFFNIKLNYNFLRQQNLNKQNSSPAVNRIMRKKY